MKKQYNIILNKTAEMIMQSVQNVVVQKTNTNRKDMVNVAIIFVIIAKRHIQYKQELFLSVLTFL